MLFDTFIINIQNMNEKNEICLELNECEMIIHVNLNIQHNIHNILLNAHVTSVQFGSG